MKITPPPNFFCVHVCISQCTPHVTTSSLWKSAPLFRTYDSLSQNIIILKQLSFLYLSLSGNPVADSTSIAGFKLVLLMFIW